MKRTALTLLLIVLMGTLFLTGCSNNDTPPPAANDSTGTQSAATPANNERIHIEYWHVNNEGFGGAAKEALIREFNEMQDRIYVTGRWNEGVYRGLISNLQAEVAAGRFPAVVQVGWALLDYFDSNFPHTEPQAIIDAHFPEDATFIQDNFLQSMQDLATTRDGRLIGLPYAVSTPVMFINRDLLREAGLSGEGPESWQDVDYFARRVFEETGRFGVYIQEPPDSWGQQALLETAGGRFLEVVDGRVQAAFYSPESIAAYTLYANLVLDGAALHISWEEGVNAFAAGEVAMLFTTIARRAVLEDTADFDLSAVAAPTWDGNRRIPTGGCMLAVLAQTPEEQAAAWEFMRFLYSHESVAEWVLGTGFMPPTSGAPEGSARLRTFLEGSEMMMASVNQLPYAVSWAPFPGDAGLQAEQMMLDKRDRILGGHQDVATALRETQTAINAILR